MDETTGRLSKCFATVFPELQPAEILKASSDSVGRWDSLSHLTLLAVIGEEFGLELELEDFQEKTSFESIRSYLNASIGNG